MAFDVHGHLFNATDVHARGYLSGPVAHSLSPSLQKVVVAAAPIVEQLGQALAISCGEEMEQLSRKLTRVRGLSTASATTSLRHEIDDETEQHLFKIEDELIRRLPGSDFGRELDRADQEYQSSQYRLYGTPPTDLLLSRDRQRIRAGLQQGAEPTSAFEALTAEARASRKLDPRGVLSFIRYMVSPRHHNLRAFQKAYTEGEGAFGIDACFAALVDFDYWLGCSETSSSLRDQVLLHEQLSVLSGGYVLPLVPYNPWTDIERPGKSFELVRWAVEERGFVGVKIYPPMGFRPLGNTDSIGSNLPRPDGAKLDANLRRLYAWCEAAGVPVMAHTAHSMGRDDAHDNLSSPNAWGAVLKEFPKLRVNAGHFGGGYHEIGQDWPKQFIDLMAQEVGVGFYADLGYEEDLLDAGSDQTARMMKLLAGTLLPHSSDPVISRVMYGSDWLMISQLPNWGSYAHGIGKFITSIPGIDHGAALRAVYFENAASCFGLRKGGTNRLRLEAFYSRWKVPTPSWMMRLDSV